MLLRLLLIVTVVALAACSFVDVRDSVTYEHDNKRVPEEVISKIVPGRTTRKWVEEYVGEPDRISKHKNGSEIFTYRFSENKKNRVRIFLLFKYENTGQREKHVYIHFVDGKVHKLWRDYRLPVIAEDMYDLRVAEVVEDDTSWLPISLRGKKKPSRNTGNEIVRYAPLENSAEEMSDAAMQSADKETMQKDRPRKWWWPF